MVTLSERAFKVLASKDHGGIRIMLLIATLALFSIVGSGFYAIPIWLNFIVTGHVNFSRNELAVLGAVPFVGILGTASAVIIVINSLQVSNAAKFVGQVWLASAFLIISWALMWWITEIHSVHSIDSNFAIVFVILLLLGTSTGMYFTILLGKIHPLIKTEHRFVYSSLGNVAFAFGSIVSLVAKLYTHVSLWMAVMLVLQCAAAACISLFVWIYDPMLTVPHEEQPRTEVSTTQLIIELACWRRQYTAGELRGRDCQVRSSQFWWMLLSFSAVTALATCFLANLGPLLSAEDDDSSLHEQTVILIWCSVSQTLARFALSCTLYSINLMVAAGVRARHAGIPCSPDSLAALIQLKVVNASALPLTFLIALVFFAFLLALKLGGSVSFVVATATMSGAYGGMWVVTTTFPLLFPHYDFGIILSMFQLCGMLALVVFTAIADAYRLGNSGIFAALLATACVTMAATVAAMVDRKLTEPDTVEGDGEVGTAENPLARLLPGDGGNQ